MDKKVEYSDTCPKCKKKMQETNRNNEKNIFYYCKYCKQKYRIEVVNHSQIIECPHCNVEICLTKKNISDLHGNSLFDFHVRKVKV